MKILFTGDINFRGLDPLDLKASEKIISEVKPYFDSADFRVVNLEEPLADKEKYSPIYKSGPNLIDSSENIVFLKALGAYAASLANNHIGDYGEGAALDTIKLLFENQIAHFGAGADINEAYKALRLEKDGVSISLISVCENEFGMATENSAGSAGYNPRLLLNKIKEEKAQSNRVIVVFHGGNEYNPLPSPDTQDRYRLICDMGADAVVAGHTHCPQGYEVYDGKPIIYSMGNFLFKSGIDRCENNSWYYGYMTVLDVSDQKISFEIIPYKFDKEVTKITVFKEENKEKMLKYIENLSDIIAAPELLENYFRGWTMEHLWIAYLPEDLNNFGNHKRAGHFNLVSCEAHFSQMKKAMEIVYLDKVDESKAWSEKIKALAVMPV